MNHHEFQVAGMSCGHCVNAIREAVADIDPQAQVQVDLARAQVVVDAAQATREALAAAIAKAGYAVR